MLTSTVALPAAFDAITAWTVTPETEMGVPVITPVECSG